MKNTSRASRTLLALGAIACGLFFATQSVSAEPASLTVEEAVKQALTNDQGIQAAVADERAGVAQAVAAKLRLLPSLSLNAGYLKLSDLPQETFKIPFGQTLIPVSFPSSPTDSYSLGASLRYPLFAGFRLTEAARIADLQTTSKQAALKMIQEAMAFETRRAYWETLRAGADVGLLQKSLVVTKALVQEVSDEVEQGLATESDLLNAKERETEAAIAMSDATSMEQTAYLTLATLIGRDAAASQIAESALSSSNESLPFALTSLPSVLPSYPHTTPIDLKALLAEALSNRGDLQAAGLGVQMAKHAQQIAAAGLYPTVAAIGDYTYASPNQRVFPPTSAFTGTWDVGLQLSFDIGGVPAAAAQTRAAAEELRKAEMERSKRQSAVTLDVQKSALSLLRAQTDLRLIRATVDQAREGLRVVQQKFDNGAAKHTDVLEAELALLKAQFGVTNGEIGVQIAAADLARSTSMPLP